MRNKQSIDYSKPITEDRYTKATNSRAQLQAKNYENIKTRLENNNRDREENRKHNSPDMNKYRTASDRQAYNVGRKGRGGNQNEDKELGRFQKRDKEDASPQYGKNYGMGSKEKAERQNGGKKELNKNSSSPNLIEERKSVQEENQQYLKLHQKLNFIQSKIADMKKHVQKKRQEKQVLLQAKKKREKQREEERKASEQRQQKGSKKVDLKQFITQVPQHKELHTFENNPYSPKHNIYYISQIIKSYKDDKSLAREHLLTSLHIFKILQNSKFASDEEMKQRQVKLPRRQGYEGKKCLIFDLDETLIHCNDTLTPPYDIKLPITFPTGQVIEAGINIRPHAHDILKNLSRYFQIIVFTASHSCYANVVLDYLDPDNEYIHHRLFRQHCYQTPEGMYCKDLRVIDRDMTEMILVDNAAYSYAAQPDNGIPILPYYHGKTDFELKALQRYLEGMVLIKDVRTLNRKTFLLQRYRNYYNEAQRLVQQLYMQEEGQN